MLVLRRVSGQQIIIAGTIRITVLRIQENQVKLGIEAPPDVPVIRGELEERDKEISQDREQTPPGAK